MTDQPTSRPLSPAAMRIIDGICDRFEQAWKVGAPPLEGYLAQAPEGCRRHLLAELASVELQYRRRPQGELVSVDEFIAAHPAIADDLRQCAEVINDFVNDDPAQRGGDDAGRPRSVISDVALAYVREPQGLHIRCPHCASPVELLADTPYEDVTCRACGSTFCLVEREGASSSAPTLRTIGRFELISRLGIGGFGTVWKARDPELDRTVAIKIPRQGQLGLEEIDFFFREARAAAQLRHPRIVAVYEIGREDDTVYIVSDFVRGVTLSDWMKVQTPTVREIAELTAVVADALDHAHEHGVVHRDLKPSNVMIDDEGQPRIMDFGLAKRETGEITMTCDGQILGTAAYMSPEQAEGKGHWIDRRADLYSLGVVMYQMATGELPYRGNFEVQLASKLSDDAPDPRKLNRYIPRDFATICLKCLERDPNRRYGGAGDVAAELRRFLCGEPIQARPLSGPARLWRWTKRKPALATAAALTALVAVAGPVTALVIDAQRRELEGRVKELDKLVIGQEQTTHALRGENSDLQGRLDELREAYPGLEEVVPEWRRNLIAAIVDRHYDAAVVALDAGDLELKSQAQIHLGLGMMLSEVSRVDDAVKHLSAAKHTLVQLDVQQPRDPRILAALAECCEQLSELHRDSGNAAEARRTAAQALEIRKRLADRRQNAVAQVDLLAAHFIFPSVILSGPRPEIDAALKAYQKLSQQVIDDWPRDATGIYRAACHLTLRTPKLTPTAEEATPTP